MADSLITDCSTGEQTTRPLTPAEQADAAQRATDEATRQQAETADETERQQAKPTAGMLTKARAIMADKQATTPTWTAAEQRVILAALVLDLAQRRRG